jgi:hypothetical protein
MSDLGAGEEETLLTELRRRLAPLMLPAWRIVETIVFGLLFGSLSPFVRVLPCIQVPLLHPPLPAPEALSVVRLEGL